MKFSVFLGSVREGRMGFRVAKHVVNLLKMKNHEVFFFDPLERPIPLLTKAYHHYANPSAEAPAWLKDLHDQVQSSDGLVVVSAEYNYSIPPALTNAMDHLPPSAYERKPCGIVSYSMGSFGGMNATSQLRSFLGVLGMVTPGTTFPIPNVDQAFSEDGQPLNDRMKRGAERLVREVEWYAGAIREYKEKNPI